MQSTNGFNGSRNARSTLARVVFGAVILIVAVALYLIIAAFLDLAPFSKSDTVQAHVEILLDRSTVMGELVGPDTSRLKEAIQSINVSILAPEAVGADNLALRQFGGSCDGDNTKLLSDFEPDNRQKIKQAISAIETGGETTLSDGLMAAISDFRNTTDLGGGSKSIVVISGGAETCESKIDNAVIGQHLRDLDIKLSFIGINVSAEAQGNLMQVINGLGGRPFFVTSPADLENRLRRNMLEILEDRDALPTGDTSPPVIDPTLASSPTSLPTPLTTPDPTVAPSQVDEGNTSSTTFTSDDRTDTPDTPAPPDTPPTVVIASPSTNTLLLTTDSISLTGSATDTEDGDLSESSMVWTSDIDGQLGTGRSISATLSSGTHNIILTATDSHQNQGSSSRSIVVTVPQPLSYQVNGVVSTGSVPQPGATIQISSPALGANENRTAVTDENGAFTVTELELGEWYYTVCKNLKDPGPEFDLCLTDLHEQRYAHFTIEDDGNGGSIQNWISAKRIPTLRTETGEAIAFTFDIVSDMVSPEIETTNACQEHVCKLDLNLTKPFPEINRIGISLASTGDELRPSFEWESFPDTKYYEVDVYDMAFPEIDLETGCLRLDDKGEYKSGYELTNYDLQPGGSYFITVGAMSSGDCGDGESDEFLMGTGAAELHISNNITQPMTGPVQAQIEVLGDNLLQLFYRDKNKEWTVYDHTGGEFSLDVIINNRWGFAGINPTIVNVIDDIPDRTAVNINLKSAATFMGQDLEPGINLIPWNPSTMNTSPSITRDAA